jgi:sigma-B regulation protein RsbU (phosphoserine phosphatase)
MKSTKKRTSIVKRLSLIWVLFALINFFIFWFISGSNQIRVISEKSVLGVQGLAYETLHRLYGLNLEEMEKKNPEEFSKTLRKKFYEVDAKKGEKAFLEKFSVITPSGRKVFEIPEKKNDKLPADAIISALKAVELRDLKSQPYFAIPHLATAEIEIYIPLTSREAESLVLMSRIPFEGLKTELRNLIFLAILMMSILFLIQIGFGFILYRLLIKPITQVSHSAVALKDHKLELIQFTTKHDDEVSQLVESFNTMAEQIVEKNKTIKDQLNALEKSHAKIQFDLRLAEKIQAAILPQKINYNNIDVAASYLPMAFVSGDFYDIHDLEDGSTAIFFSDVSGHGVPAALLTVLAKVALNTILERTSEPSQVMSEMNNVFFKYFDGSGLYLTGIFLKFLPDGRLQYCNGMHPAPIIVGTNKVYRSLQNSGFYLGLALHVNELLDDKESNNFKYETIEERLSADETLILYTDGITEAFDDNNKMFSIEGILKAADGIETEPEKILVSIKRNLLEFKGNPDQRDDESILTVRYNSKLGAVVEKVHADVFFGQKKYAEAAAAYEEMRSTGEFDNKSSMRLALAYNRIREYAKSNEILETATQSFGRNHEFEATRGLNFFFLGDHKRAVETVDDALQDFPGNGNLIKIQKFFNTQLGNKRSA